MYSNKGKFPLYFEPGVRGGGDTDNCIHECHLAEDKRRRRRSLRSMTQKLRNDDKAVKGARRDVDKRSSTYHILGKPKDWKPTGLQYLYAALSGMFLNARQHSEAAEPALTVLQSMPHA